MKLLLDQNFSHLLTGRLVDLFPDIAHVRNFGLERAEDVVIWEFAWDRQYIIVSKDGDFRQMSFLRGAPPKTIWLNVGNCSTSQIEAVLRAHVIRIIAFERDPVAALLVLP